MERSLQKQNLHLTKEAVDGTVHCKPGAAELLVQEVYEILTNRSVRDAERPGLDFTDREYQERLPTLARPTASTAIKSNLATTETMAEPDVSTNRRKAEVILRRHLEDRAAERALHPGCLECCIKCLGGIPYPSLIATILLYAGVALFCGCGHEALSGTVTILQNYFEVMRSPVDALDVFTMIDIIKYVIYGIASAFFVYGILLMVEGFFTSGAIKDLYGDFKITTCGRCVSAWFIMLTYIFMLAWLGVTAFTSLPVFIYFNIWNICQNATVLEGATLCLDPRQYGIVPIADAKTVCAGSEKFYKMCESNELDMTFHLFICALAGAGAAVIAMIHYLMVLSANWAYVKDACRMQKYEDIKSKEEQELHDIHSTRSKERLNAYT
ncbi:putative neuronal membrane glycoprotein M6-a [Scophthalmus maximus]|uniref:Putative neuronal membrane glycoprotein M6-a n=3 Tax=Euteleosteomorpha TaxID=1489388 RepID=A0A2U9CA08_SCOMX|nr:putative neuronal membrane glycoprotein M6-a [Scophthalmus maximus]